MTIKGTIKGYFLKKALKNIKKVSPLEKNIDSMMSEEMKTMTATNRTIDKLLKVKIMRQETQNTLQKIHELDDNYEDEDEEEDEAPDFEQQMKQMLMNKILGGVTGAPNPEEVPQEPMGSEVAASNPLVDGIMNLTPAEIGQLKSKFFKQ